MGVWDDDGWGFYESLGRTMSVAGHHGIQIGKMWDFLHLGSEGMELKSRDSYILSHFGVFLLIVQGRCLVFWFKLLFELWLFTLCNIYILHSFTASSQYSSFS